MKRKLSVLLCLLLVFVFAACSKSNEVEPNTSSKPKMTFESAEIMKENVDGVWMNCKSGDYLIIKDGQLSKFDAQTKQDALNRLSGQVAQFDSFKNFYVRYLEECGEEIEYDNESGSVILSRTNTVFFEMHDKDSAFNENSVMFIKEFISEDKLKDDIAEEYINLKYTNLPTNKDVQFDKYGNIGKNFMITGTAELDDYYNWGYKDFEVGYFCIQITPIGGNISDRWYVYASRSEFSELFDELKTGPKNAKLVAKLIFPDTGSNNMATLVESF